MIESYLLSFGTVGLCRAISQWRAWNQSSNNHLSHPTHHLSSEWSSRWLEIVRCNEKWQLLWCYNLRGIALRQWCKCRRDIAVWSLNSCVWCLNNGMADILGRRVLVIISVKRNWLSNLFTFSVWPWPRAISISMLSFGLLLERGQLNWNIVGVVHSGSIM